LICAFTEKEANKTAENKPEAIYRLVLIFINIKKRTSFQTYQFSMRHASFSM